jgi:hypothetical protein
MYVPEQQGPVFFYRNVQSVSLYLGAGVLFKANFSLLCSNVVRHVFVFFNKYYQLAVIARFAKELFRPATT